MVCIRFTRAGAKKAPFYRIVVTDERSPRDGKFLEVIGTFHPRKQAGALILKKDRVAFWQERGAKVSDTLAQAIKNHPEQPAAAAATPTA